VKIQDQGEARSYALVAAVNALIRKLVDEETTFPHYEISGVTVGDYRYPVTTAKLVTLSSTADLPAVKAMANEARTVLVYHLTDANAHKLADTTRLALINTTTLAELVTADSQATTDTFINALSAAYEAHRIDTDLHSHADSTNLYTASSAVDLASSKLAIGDVKAQTNAHIQLSWTTPSIELV